MSTNISRRKVVAGAAWATPVVAASAVVPAFASSTECEWESTPKFSISGTDTGAKTVQKFVVPAKVDKISFVIKGGAGGTQYSIPGGAAAQISGTIAVKEGQTVEIVSAAGGVGYDEDTPAEGGEGYGNGGSSKGDNPIPESIINKVKDAGGSNRHMLRSPKFASSGGGSSAIIVDGTVIAVAGGGGGVGYIRAGGTNLNPAYVFPGATNAGWWKSDTYPRNLPFLLSKAGNASGLAGGAGEKGSGAYTADHDQVITVEPGKGGATGQGGQGGLKTELPTNASPNGEVLFYSTNNQELYSSSTSGEAGSDGFTGNGADGVSSYSYQIDYNTAGEPKKKPDGRIVYYTAKASAPQFTGFQSIYSGGGGAGYGGGGSGASVSITAMLKQKWDNNPQGVRQPVGFGQLAGGGGAGGSYIHSSVIGAEITASKDVPTGRGQRKNGSVAITYCKRS